MVVLQALNIRSPAPSQSLKINLLFLSGVQFFFFYPELAVIACRMSKFSKCIHNKKFIPCDSRRHPQQKYTNHSFLPPLYPNRYPVYKILAYTLSSSYNQITGYWHTRVLKKGEFTHATQLF